MDSRKRVCEKDAKSFIKNTEVVIEGWFRPKE